jgi:hypothetical protein
MIIFNPFGLKDLQLNENKHYYTCCLSNRSKNVLFIKMFNVFEINNIRKLILENLFLESLNKDPSEEKINHTGIFKKNLESIKQNNILMLPFNNVNEIQHLINITNDNAGVNDYNITNALDNYEFISILYMKHRNDPSYIFMLCEVNLDRIKDLSEIKHQLEDIASESASDEECISKIQKEFI